MQEVSGVHANDMAVEEARLLASKEQRLDALSQLQATMVTDGAEGAGAGATSPNASRIIPPISHYGAPHKVGGATASKLRTLRILFASSFRACTVLLA